MTRSVALVAIIGLALSGCISPYQQQYFTTDCRSDSLPDNQGAIISSDGKPATPNSVDPNQTNRRLITFVVLASPMNETSQKFNSGGAVAKYSFSTGKGSELIEVHMDWDKKRDVVEYEGAEFPRSNGELFVILKKPGSKGKIWQLKSPSKTRPQDIYETIERELGDIAEVKEALHVRQ